MSHILPLANDQMLCCCLELGLGGGVSSQSSEQRLQRFSAQRPKHSVWFQQKMSPGQSVISGCHTTVRQCLKKKVEMPLLTESSSLGAGGGF